MSRLRTRRKSKKKRKSSRKDFRKSRGERGLRDLCFSISTNGVIPVALFKWFVSKLELLWREEGGGEEGRRGGERGGGGRGGGGRREGGEC